MSNDANNPKSLGDDLSVQCPAVCWRLLFTYSLILAFTATTCNQFGITSEGASRVDKFKFCFILLFWSKSSVCVRLLIVCWSNYASDNLSRRQLPVCWWSLGETDNWNCFVLSTPLYWSVKCEFVLHHQTRIYKLLMEKRENDVIRLGRRFGQIGLPICICKCSLNQPLTRKISFSFSKLARQTDRPGGENGDQRSPFLVWGIKRAPYSGVSTSISSF